MASEMGDKATVTSLLQSGVNPNFRDRVRKMCIFMYTQCMYMNICMLFCCVCAQYRDYELVSMYSSVGTLHWASSCTL